MVIEKGTVKVVWASKNGKKIYSKMFDSPQDAVKFGESKKHFLIFQLVGRKKMEEFEWKLLPYGHSKLYFSLFNKYMKILDKINK